MSPLLQDLAGQAIHVLDQVQGSAGCNDLEVPNTDEMRAVWREYNVWNAGAECTGPEHDQWMDFPESDEPTVIVNDGVLLYVLRKHFDLL